jgi:hypothetical protein
MLCQRVQLGVALTPAERLQAITGPFPTLIREVQALITSDDGFDDNMDWASARGRDFQSIASVVYLIHRIPSQTFPGASTLDKWMQQQTPIDRTLREAVIATFKKFISLVRNPKLNTPFTKPTRVSPIEFVMIGLLIFMLRTKLTDEEISRCIRDMRSDVRSQHADVRSNTKVTKTMFTFINDLVQKGARSKTLASSQKQKRKRGDSSDDELPRSKSSTSTPRNARASTSDTQPQTLRKPVIQAQGLSSSNSSLGNGKLPTSDKAAPARPSAPNIRKRDTFGENNGSKNQSVKTATTAPPSSMPISSTVAPSTQSLRAIPSLPTPSRLKPQPSKPAPPSSLPPLNPTPPTPSTSTSKPVLDIQRLDEGQPKPERKESETDIFAAIRQAKAKAANVKALISASPIERVLPSEQSKSPVESTPTFPQPVIVTAMQPIITDSRMPVDENPVAVAGSQGSIPSAAPKGPANSTYGNIMMLRNLSMTSQTQTSSRFSIDFVTIHN